MIPPRLKYDDISEKLIDVDDLVSRNIWLSTSHDLMLQMLKRVKAGLSLDTDDRADLARIEAGYPGGKAR